MRLSEDRINAIAEKIARQLVKKRMIAVNRRLYQIASWVEKPILEDIEMEEKIDEEVHRHLQGLKNKPPVGSFEYQAMFQKKKEEVARRHNYTV